MVRLEKNVEANPDDKEELEKRLRFFQSTDMAVVVPSSQDEIEEFRKKGLDIATHRKRMVKEDLETKFKNPDNPLRIVFVCAMWITGFDVPACSTMYLDKPMKNHTLMQTIARANRVWRDKQNGLIVDYVGIFRNLQKALAIYGATQDGDAESPIKDIAELGAQLYDAIADLTVFSKERGVDPVGIQEAMGFDREKLKDDAVAAFVVNDDTRRRYLQLAGNVDRLFKSLLPDVAANEFNAICRVFSVIAAKIRSDLPAADISDYGWQAVMEVEEDGGWNRFWVRDKNFFRGQGARGRIEPKDGSRFAVLGNWFHAATPAIEGGERSWIWAAVSLSMTTMRPPHLGQSGSGLGSWAGEASGSVCDGCRTPSS